MSENTIQFLYIPKFLWMSYKKIYAANNTNPKSMPNTVTTFLLRNYLFILQPFDAICIYLRRTTYYLDYHPLHITMKRVEYPERYPLVNRHQIPERIIFYDIAEAIVTDLDYNVCFTRKLTFVLKNGSATSCFNYC